MAGFRGIRHNTVAELLIDVGGKNRTLERTGNDRRRKEEALIQRGHQTQIRADLLSQTRGGKAIGTAVNAGLRAADVAADGRESAARILDERADNHVRADVAGLNRLDKFAVAVVHHADDAGTDALHKGNQLANLLDRERRAGRVTLAALDGDELGALVDGVFNALVVDGAVLKQRNLCIADTVFLQRTGAFADADDFLQRVIRTADRGEQLVARQQVCAQCDGQRVRSAGNLRTDQRGFRMEAVGVDALERVASDVVVAIARCAGKAADVDAVFLHGGENLRLIILGDAVNFIKARAQRSQNIFAEAVDGFRNAELFKNIILIHCLLLHFSFPIWSRIFAARLFSTSGLVTIMPFSSSPRMSSVSPGRMPYSSRASLGITI